MKKRVYLRIKKILITSSIMILGILIFKSLPMLSFNKNILFDASYI
ncbi:MAG: hypothetical protein AABW83_02650 [Nanoarchaeota archaeon]